MSINRASPQPGNAVGWIFGERHIYSMLPPPKRLTKVVWMLRRKHRGHVTRCRYGKRSAWNAHFQRGQKGLLAVSCPGLAGKRTGCASHNCLMGFGMGEATLSQRNQKPLIVRGPPLFFF